MIDELHIQLHVTHRTAVDELEPMSCPPADLREAAQRYVAILEAFASRIELGISEENLKSVKVAFWGPAYALGLSCCEGMSMTERSLQIGVQRVTISKAARMFIEANELPPSRKRTATLPRDSHKLRRAMAMEQSIHERSIAGPSWEFFAAGFIGWRRILDTKKF